VLKAGANAESRAMASDAAAQGSRRTRRPRPRPERRDHLRGFWHRPGLQDRDVRAQAWKDTPEKIFGAPFKAGSLSADISPELLGVGYIIGPRIAAIMMGGGVLPISCLFHSLNFLAKACPQSSHRGKC